jgi:hypothetical protein
LISIAILIHMLLEVKHAKKAIQEERCAKHTLPLALAFAFSANSAVCRTSRSPDRRNIGPGPGDGL